jgi:hypothetical protein
VIEQVGQLGQLGVLTTIGTLATAAGAAYLAFLRYKDRRETAKENHEATVAAEAAKKAAEEAAAVTVAATEANSAQLIELNGKIYALGNAVDGRLSALIQALEEKADLRVASALAAGRIEGGAQEKADEAGRVAEAANGGRREKDATGKLP